MSAGERARAPATPAKRDDAGPTEATGASAPRLAAAEPAPDVLRLEFRDHRSMHDLLGHQDEYVKAIEQQLGVRIGVSDNTLSIAGDEIERELASNVLTQLWLVIWKVYHPHESLRPGYLACMYVTITYAPPNCCLCDAQALSSVLNR